MNVTDLGEDPERGVYVFPVNQNTLEGVPTTYSVALTSEPTGDVTVTPQVPVDSPRARTSGPVTFTPQDWWKLQTITVTPEETGRSGSDYIRTIAHSVTGADYGSNNVRARAFAVAVEDRFHATASLELSPNTVNEDVGSIEIIVTSVWHSEYAPTRPHVYGLISQSFPGKFIGNFVYRELLPEARSAADYSPISEQFAIRPPDFERADDGTARFIGTRTFSFTILEDDIYERDEDAGIYLHNVPGWPVGNFYTDMEGLSILVESSRIIAQLVIVDNDPSGITFPSTRLEVTEEDATGAAYTLEMVSEPAEDVFIDISGTQDSDVTVSPATVTFTPANWDTPKTVRVTAAHDDDLVDDEVTLTHRARGPVPGENKAERRLYDDHDLPSVMITVKDNDVVPVSVSFEQSDYTVAEGGSVTVKVTLSEDPERTVIIPISKANQDGASNSDYSGVPADVTFNSGDTEKTFSFTATDDTVDDDGESVKLSFGTLPAGVTEGTISETTVSITDDDDLQVSVSFGQNAYTVAEGDDVTVTVTLSEDPERTVIIPISKANQDGASNGDYSGVPANVTFNSGDTEKTFSFTATNDTVDDDGESVKLSFGTLPAGVTEGTNGETTVSITDNDVPEVEVRFRRDSDSIEEGITNGIIIELSADPERTVVVPIVVTHRDGATADDYSGVPANVVFQPGQILTYFNMKLIDDNVVEDAEILEFTFGTLPDRVTEGTPNKHTLTINDPLPTTVSFGSATYSVEESDDPSTPGKDEREVEITVNLNASPGLMVTIPITATNESGATSADHSGVPASLVFGSHETSKTFSFTATDDTVDDDGESVKLGFGTLPTWVSEGTISETTVSIIDDDDLRVSVSFEQSSYTVAEGDRVTVKVTLSEDPAQTVTIPITATNESGTSDSDYSGVPANVTFNSGDTEKSFTFSATDDTVDDDDESVKLGFGTLPAGVTEGTNGETTVSITDNDVPSDRLMSLVVAPKDIDGFDSEIPDYMVGVAAGVTQATITPTAFRSDDAITINGTTVASGSAHTVDLSAGLNTFEVVVSSAGSSDPTTYRVYIGRGTTAHGGWKAGDDLDTLRAAGIFGPGASGPTATPSGSATEPMSSSTLTPWPAAPATQARISPWTQATPPRACGPTAPPSGSSTHSVARSMPTPWPAAPATQAGTSAVSAVVPWAPGPMAPPYGSSTIPTTSSSPTPWPAAPATQAGTSL